MSDPMFSIEAVLTGADPLLRLTGELDLHGSSELRDAALKIIGEGAPNLVLDLAGLTFIDSTGLGVCVGILKRLRHDGDGDLILRSPTHPVQRVMELTGLDKVFTIEA